MGIFTKMQETSAVNQYSEIRKYLHPKDGKLHVIMINSFSKFVNQIFGCEDKYTTQIDTILQYMQNDGFQIIDVKFNSVQGQGVNRTMEGFHTLITYC